MTAAKSDSPPTYDEALAKVLAAAPAIGDETVSLDRALRRVLKQSILADRDQPPFDRSAMDGFAVRSTEVSPAGSDFPIIGSVPAGGAPATFQDAMPPGSVRRIATGAPLPRGADAVVPIEQAAVAQGKDGERVGFSVPRVSPWQNVHRRASDATAGQVVIPAGVVLGPQHVGIAAAVGATSLTVTQVPRITLLTTGDEVVPPEVATAKLEPQQIRNSNGPMLAAFLATLACPLLYHEHVPDDPERTRAAAREALSRSHLVITVGGVSVGQRDYLPASWQHLGLETILHGVNIQPGKPVFIARDDSKLVIGLPGNPVSVLATAHLFVWPVLRQILGCASPGLPWRECRLAEPVKGSAKRLAFRAAKLHSDNTAKVIQWHGSGDLVHTTSADGLVRLPMTDDPVAAGTAVKFLPLVG